jgi:flagellar biosynthesis chaperone FliJ
MNTNIDQKFAKVKDAYAGYLAARREATKYKGQVSQRMATWLTQKAQQEIHVLESNVVYYKSILRRVRPSTNKGFTKVQKRNMSRAIDMLNTYISDYEKVNTAWKPYVSKQTNKTVSLVRFPVRVTNTRPATFATALNTYFNAVMAKYNSRTTFNNMPIIPVKRNITNLRGKTIPQARTTKTTLSALKEDVNMLTKTIQNQRKAQRISQTKYNAVKKNATNMAEYINYLLRTGGNAGGNSAHIQHLEEMVNSLSRELAKTSVAKNKGSLGEQLQFVEKELKRCDQEREALQKEVYRLTMWAAFPNNNNRNALAWK